MSDDLDPQRYCRDMTERPPAPRNPRQHEAEQQPHGISIDDVEEIERRAQEARSGVPGIPWDELKRDLLT